VRICSYTHERIVYSSPGPSLQSNCPLCAVLAELREALDDLEAARAEVARLEAGT
jgi:hypothetical protein